MKKLLFLLLLLPMLAMAQQTRPTSPVQKPQNTPYLDTSTGIRWFFDGTVFWPVAPYNPTNMVMSGLSLTVVSNTLTVHTGTWRINNTIYTLGTNTNLTLQARDSVLYHYEAVYATAANNGVGLKVGTTSLTPIQPTVGADTLIVGLVLIAPDGTSVFPPGPASDFVFAHPTVKQLDANPWTRTERTDTLKIAGQYIFPSRRGLSGQVLQDPGDGNLFWSYQATYLNGFGLNLSSQTFSADTFKMVTTTAMMDTLRRNAAHFNPTQFSIVNDTINCVACGLTAVSTNNGISGDGSGPSPVILGGNPLTHSTEIDGTGFDFDIVAGSGNSLAKISLLNNRTINFISRKSATDFGTINVNTSGSQNFITLFINASGGKQKAITMDQGITGIVFSDSFNHIGPVADGNIDTANMTITPKMYVTSEWVLHHAGTGGAFLPLDFAADQNINQHGHILNLGAPNSLGGAGIHIDSTQFDAHVLDVGGDYGSDLYLDTLSSSLETQGHTRLTAVVLDTINVLVYHKNNLTGDRFEFDATDEASGFGRSNAGVTTLVHVNTAFPGIMVTDNFNHKGLREDSTSIDENNYTDYNYITKRNADSAYVHGVTGGYLPLILPADNTVSLSSHSLYFSTNDGIGTKMFSDGSVVLGATPSQTPLGSTLTITNTPGFGNNFFLAGNFSINNAGIPNTLTPSPHDNSTAVATTAYVDAAVTAGGGISALTGDVTASGTGSVAATLATVNFTTGSFGDGTHVGSFDVNGKGLVTAASSVAISFPVTASNSVTFTNKAGNISQWTNNSGYITTISGVAAGGELAGTYPNPTLLNSAVIAKLLTGYVSGAGTLAATDNILQGFNKINGNEVLDAANIATNTSNIALKLNISDTASMAYVHINKNESVLGQKTFNKTILLGSNATLNFGSTTNNALNTFSNNISSNTALTLSTTAANSIIFSQNSAESARFNASGRLLIASTTDDGASKLQVYGGTGHYVNGIAATPTDGLILANTTASTSGVTAQYSPNMHLFGHVWNTTATAADNFFDWRIYATGVSGTTPSTVLNFDWSRTVTGTPSYTNLMTMTANNVSVTGAFGATTTIQGATLIAASGGLTVTNNVMGGTRTALTNTIADGLQYKNTTASTVGSTVQYSPAIHLGAQVWNTTATAANNWADFVEYLAVGSAASPTATLTWGGSLSTTSTPSYTTRMSLDNNGNLTVTGALASGNSSGNVVTANVSFANPRANLQAVNFDGYVTSNTQAATVGVPNQWSPSNRYTAEVWNTTATAANNFTDWITFVKTNSAAVPTSSYTWSSSLTTTSTPSYTQRMALDNSGNLALLTGNLSIPLGKELQVAEGTNGFVGQTTLVAGTKAISITGVTTGSRAFIQLVSQGGTSTTTWQFAGVCTANTLTITAITTAGATNASDTSVVNYQIIN